MATTIRGIDLSELLKDIPRGAWVAISDDRKRVIAFGSDVRKVLEDAQKKGEKNPVLTRVPESTTTLAL